MKIQINGPHSEVKCVRVDIPNPFMLSVFIDTTKHWKDMHLCAISSMSGIVEYEFEQDIVRLISETEEESKLLDEAPFTRHCKNQMHFMYMDEVGLNRRLNEP